MNNSRNNGDDPVISTITDVYNGLTEEERLEFDHQCSVFLKNIRLARRSRSPGIGDLGTMELLGKLGIYLVMKSEQAEAEETGEDIWEGLFCGA